MRVVFVRRIALTTVFLALAGPAFAKVRVHINLSSQQMTVESSSGAHVWPVSTARAGFTTPRGSYAPTGMQRMHYSKKYHNSPMPNSIFFHGGYAIHGTYATGFLGRAASHGCVRLSPAHAAQLFNMVEREGASITISGSAPHSVRYGMRKSRAYANNERGDVPARAHRVKDRRRFASRENEYDGAWTSPGPVAPGPLYYRKPQRYYPRPAPVYGSPQVVYYPNGAPVLLYSRQNSW